MSDIFLDLFSNLFSIVFSLNCGYLFCLTFITMKITMKEQREKRERKTKISYSINKTFGEKKMVRGHSFMTFAKKCKIRRPPLLLYPQTYNFGLRSLHSWTFLIDILYLQVISEFFSKTLTIRST